jgi:hypothetical protein
MWAMVGSLEELSRHSSHAKESPPCPRAYCTTPGDAPQFGLEGLDPADYRLVLTVERDGETVTEVRRFSVGS